MFRVIRKGSRQLATWVAIVLLYCLPCLIVLGIVISFNYGRVNDVAHKYAEEVCKHQKDQKEDLSKQLKEFITLTKGCCECEKANTEESTKASTKALYQWIWPVFFENWRGTALFVSTLTLLPFFVLGSGLAYKYVSEESVNNTKPRWSLLKLSLRDSLLKYLVAFAIALGWLYTFNPNGQGGSAVNAWLKYQETVSSDTSPIVFNLSESSLKHLVVAFLGWYLYLLGYFSYRLYKSDVTSTKIYSILFRRFLFVLGIAIVLSSVSGKESLLVIFLIATFPLSAVTLLTEYGNKRLSMGEDQTSLSIIPGISTWQILRLEEEGIDSVSTLATSKLDELALVISDKMITPEVLEHWIDIARLVTVIGPKKWEEIRGISLTASKFVENVDKERNLESAKDSGFKTKLNEYQVFNADEIADILRKTFGLKPMSKT